VCKGHNGGRPLTWTRVEEEEEEEEEEKGKMIITSARLNLNLEPNWNQSSNGLMNRMGGVEMCRSPLMAAVCTTRLAGVEPPVKFPQWPIGGA